MTSRTFAAWVVRRLAVAAAVVAGVAVVTFVLIHLAPGDPIYLLAGDGGSPAYYADMRARYGLDRPLPAQLATYLAAVLTLDFGYSFVHQAPVSRVLLAHAPASLLLGGAALALATAAGLFAGVLPALTRSLAVDRVVRWGASITYASPVFWTGQIFVYVFAVRLGILPAAGITTARETLTGLAAGGDVLRHLLLPALTLSLPFAAIIARVVRAALVEIAREPFVLATSARGFSRARVLLGHAVPNVLPPVVTLVGLHAAQLAAGAALIEALFGWPGVGHLVLQASLHRDYPLVVGAFIGISASVVFFNAAADAVCAWLDPRVRQT
ncbi:MAG TPA: ABC transporter permease [Vicinamibacterales bacterium]|nr:ABC transporter permease [Vicinamibacterales bacterium]